jgi:outer membrane lipoprotein-sorting protein
MWATRDRKEKRSKKMFKKKIIMTLTLVLAFGAAFSAFTQETADKDLKEIMDVQDKLYRSDTSRAEISMTIVTPNWERTMDIEFWTEGLDKTFIFIKSPKKDKGTATLRIGKEMWNYFPKINKVMQVPPSMMMGAWMGSDFTNDDLVKESTFLDDFKSKLVVPEDGDPNHYYIESIPKEETVTVWGKITFEIEKDTLIPLKQIYYDEKGKAMRIMTFSEVKEFNGKKIPTVMEMIPLSERKKGNKTLITYTDVEFDVELSDDTFSMRNLQKKR